jgi:prepilin-type N-terminal cleavage/methylation domain-containing protein
MGLPIARADAGFLFRKEVGLTIRAGIVPFDRCHKQHEFPVTSPKMMSPTSRRRAFSLIELMVVVAIIALLITLASPILEKSLETGRRAQARTDAAQIAHALENYLSEYGKFPVESAGNVNSQDLMNTLAAVTKGDPNNPRSVTFLNIPRAKAHKHGAESSSSGVYSSAYKDSWANKFEIRIDNEGGAKSYDGSIDGPDGVVHASVIVWSKGNPRDVTSYSTPARWIKSWE